MQKLIMILTETDGCSYSADIIVPFEYESLEAFFCLLDDKANEIVDSLNSHQEIPYEIQVGPVWIDPKTLVYHEVKRITKRRNEFHWVKYLPSVETLEDWFREESTRWEKPRYL
jgi:hypothetical protein